MTRIAYAFLVALGTVGLAAGWPIDLRIGVADAFVVGVACLATGLLFADELSR